MKNFLNISRIAIMALCAFLLFKTCEKRETVKEIVKIKGKSYEVIKHDIDTVEVVKDTTIYKKGADIYHDTTIYVEIPTYQPIDTLSILRDFFAKNIYKDTLRLPDSLGWVILNDTISQNKIFSREFTANIKQREIKEVSILRETPKTQVYFGVNASLDKYNFLNSVSTGLILKTKSDRMYQLNLGVTGNELTPTLVLGMYWKIKLRK